MEEAGTTTLQTCLDRLRSGDLAARTDLLTHSQRRLRLLTERMLGKYPRLRRWEAADDLFQEVQIRLYQALRSVPVSSVLDYLRLASWHIRNVLIDATRKYLGPRGQAANRASPDGGPAGRVTNEPAESSEDPAGLAAWAELHQLIHRMPDDFRTVFDLVWYHGMSHADAAELLQLSVSTVQRRWTAARLWLRESFRGELPV